VPYSLPLSCPELSKAGLDCISNAQAQVREEVERERRQWRKDREQRAVAKREKHVKIAQRVAQELVGLALLQIEYASQTGLKAPSKVKRGWITMFLAGDTRLCSAETQVCRLLFIFCTNQTAIYAYTLSYFRFIAIRFIHLLACIRLHQKSQNS
jgi:hypothetical protein